MKKFPLNLTFLKYFYDAVRTESISESAKFNFVSQSAISQAIAKLEERLQCELIFHQPNRFKVTEKGLQLFESARDIFQTVQKAENLISQQEGGTLTFGCTHSFAIELLPDYLKQAREQFPSLHIQFRLGQYYTIKELMKKGLIDFGILLDNDDLSLFDCKPIYQGLFRLYASRENGSIDHLGFLLDNNERKESNWLHQAYRDRFGQELPIAMEVTSWEVIANLTEKGVGIGFFPDYLAHRRHHLIQEVLPELHQIPYTLYAIFSKTRSLNPYALKLCELFTQLSQPPGSSSR